MIDCRKLQPVTQSYAVIITEDLIEVDCDEILGRVCRLFESARGNIYSNVFQD
jgi:hypothetical protein